MFAALHFHQLFNGFFRRSRFTQDTVPGIDENLVCAYDQRVGIFVGNAFCLVQSLMFNQQLCRNAGIHLLLVERRSNMKIQFKLTHQLHAIRTG